MILSVSDVFVPTGYICISRCHGSGKHQCICPVVSFLLTSCQKFPITIAYTYDLFCKLNQSIKDNKM